MSFTDSHPTRRQALGRLGAGAGLGLGLMGSGAAALLGSSQALADASTTATTGPGGVVPEVVLVRRMVKAGRLALYCYGQVLAGGLVASEQRPWLEAEQSHEQAHVALLAARLSALGGAPVAPPADPAEANRQLGHHHIAQRVGQLRGPKDALRLLVSVEQLMVGSCFDALGRLQDPSMISLTLRIMASDAQHVALLRVLLYPNQGAQWAPYALVEGNA